MRPWCCSSACWNIGKSGSAPKTINYPRIDVLSAELEAFADTVEHKRPFPATETEVLATLSAFEAALESMESGHPVVCDGG